MQKRKIDYQCERCHKNVAKGFSFEMPENYEALLEEFRMRLDSECEDVGILSGKTLVEAWTPESALNIKIRKRDAFFRAYFPKDDVLLVCSKCADAHYYVSFADFFASPSEAIDWIAHLDGKNWMGWPSFVAACKRMRKF